MSMTRRLAALEARVPPALAEVPEEAREELERRLDRIRENLLANAEAGRARIKELNVCAYVDGELAAVSTAVLRDVPFLVPDLPDHRPGNVVASRSTLADERRCRRAHGARGSGVRRADVSVSRLPRL